MASPEEGWARRGFSCGLFTDPPGQQWLDFTHDVDELFMVEEGEVRLTVDGESFVAEPGKEYYIPRGVKHSVENVGESFSRWWYGYEQS